MFTNRRGAPFSKVIFAKHIQTILRAGMRQASVLMISSRRWYLVLLMAFIIVDFSLIFPFFVSQGLPNHGDAGFPFYLSRFKLQFTTLFNDYGSVSFIESINRALFMLPLVLLGEGLGLGMGQFVGLLYLILLFLSQIAIFLLSRLMIRRIGNTENENHILLGSFVASITYSLSPWMLEQIQAPYYWLAYALTPLAIYLFITALEKKSFAFPRIFALSLVLTFIFTTPQYFVYTIGVMIFLTIALVMGAKLSKRYLILNVLTLIFTTFVLNFYWIFPSIVIVSNAPTGLSPGYVLTKDQVSLFSQNSTPLNVLLSNDQWTGWYPSDRNTFWIAISFVIPLSSLYSLRYISRKEIKILWILFVIFFILALGTNTRLYDIILKLPFNWIWRVPPKLSYFLWTTYAIGIAILISDIAKGVTRKYVKMISISIVYCILFSTFAMANGSKVWDYFGFYYSPHSFPKEYYELNDWLSKQDGDFKVLYLSAYLQGLGKNNLHFESSFTWDPNRIIGQTIEYSSEKPAIGYIHFTYRDWQSLLYPKIYGSYGSEFRVRNNIGEILQPYDVKYVVYTTDIVGTEKEVKEDLNKLQNSDLRQVQKFGNLIYVYENPYLGSEIKSFSLGYTTKLDYVKYSSTQYEIALSKYPGTVPFTISFAKAYDPLWIAKYDSKTIHPTKNENGLIDFKIDEKTDYVTIEYLPQRYYNTGLLVSFLAYTVSLAIIVLNKLRLFPFSYLLQLRAKLSMPIGNGQYKPEKEKQSY